MNAGRKDHRPIEADWSIAGTSRLQIEAATITPPAKPVRALVILRLRFFLRKKTQAAPAEVPMKGISKPVITVFIVY